MNDEFYHKYFFEAVADNNISVVRQLLSFGRDSDQKDENAKTVKTVKAKKTKWSAFEWNESDDSENDNISFNKLLETDNVTDTEWLKWMNRKIDVNMTDTNGRTPLFCVAYNGYWKMCKLLMVNGSDVDVVDIHGQNALDAAHSGLKNAESTNKNKQIQQIIELLTSRLKSKCIRPTIDQKEDNLNDINPGNQRKRRYVTNDEVIWTSSLIYIGNLPRNMTENEISHFVQKHHINPSQIINRGNYTLVRTRENLKTLNIKINQINGIFFRGAMVTVNLFERSKNRDYDSSKPQSLSAMNDDSSNIMNPGGLEPNYNKKREIISIPPNTALFVNNFDVEPGIYDVLREIFEAFGSLSRALMIGVDKFGDPFCKVTYYELNDAVKCWNDGIKGIKLGSRTLKIEYSKFAQTMKPRYRQNDSYHHQYARSQYQQNHENIRPKPQENNDRNRGRGRMRTNSYKNDKNMNGERVRGRGRARKNARGRSIKHKKALQQNKDDKNINKSDDGWVVKGRKAKNKKRKIKRN